MIQRFEDEYPECKLPPSPSELRLSGTVEADPDIPSAHTETDGPKRTSTDTEAIDDDATKTGPLAVKLSRTTSNTSLASKALTHEEGRMHRYGQSVRREIALAHHAPAAADDEQRSRNPHTTTTTTTTTTATAPTTSDEERRAEASRLRVLQERIANMRGEEIAQFREQCYREGVEKALQDLGVTTQELLVMERSDPDAFERFCESQVAARFNAGFES